MEQIALIAGNTYVYWRDIIRVLAAAAAVSLFLALYLRRQKRAMASCVCVPLAVSLSMILSRLAVWYFLPDSYENIAQVLELQVCGGSALMGAFAGCLLTAVLLWALRLEKDLLDLLDCMSIAGALGIAVGRLASFFDASDRGMTVAEDFGLPWVIAVKNPVSGVAEYRVAVFLLQAMAAGVIFLILLTVYLTGKRKRGGIILYFLLCYGASQVVLDSLRYDALHLRSNGFVHVVQVFGIGAVILVCTVFAVRMVRAGGWKKWHFALWFLQLGCLVTAGYMEYYVQRHGSEAVFAYSMMSISMLMTVAAAVLTDCRARAEKRRHDLWLQQIGRGEKGESTDGENECR